MGRLTILSVAVLSVAGAARAEGDLESLKTRLAAAQAEYDTAKKGVTLSGDIGGVHVKCAMTRIAAPKNSDLLLVFKECFQINLELKGTIANKKVEYEGWTPGTGIVGEDKAQWAKLHDEFGNKYRPIGHFFGLDNQVDDYAAIHPDRVTKETLYFELPISTAETLTLELPGAAVGVDGKTLTLVIPAGHRMEVMQELTKEKHRIEDLIAKEERTEEIRRFEAEAEKIAAADKVLIGAGHRYRPRTWATSDGKFSVEASYVRSTKDSVSLKRLDNGKEVKVVTADLRDEDRTYVTEQHYRTDVVGRSNPFAPPDEKKPKVVGKKKK